jgi:hypothetical protein
MTEVLIEGRTVAPSSRRFWDFVQTREFGVLAASTALLVIGCYVFLFTPYHEFLYSDMRSFWLRALDRLKGETFADSQFQAWPPIYHILLAELFRIFQAIGMEGLIRLETALAINIAVFALSVYAFQRLASHWFANPVFVAVAVTLYAFGFPSLYFSAFLLSGNLGGPLMVIAVAVVCCRQTWTSVVVGALLLALAAAIRPSFAPYGLAFVILYFARYGMSWEFVRRAAAFSAVFFAVVLLASAEVGRISGGRVFGLSANGGLDFFISNTDYHKVDLSYNGWHFFVVVPGYSLKPENGTYYTNVPFYHQDYYFRLGWEALKRDPSQLWRNLENVKNLFFARMLPSRPDAPGFSFFIPAWDWLKFGMFLTLGLYVWLWRRLGVREPMFWMLIHFIIITAIVSYLFTGEPRYTYSIMFVFYLLFFKLLELLRGSWRNITKPLLIYASVLLATGTATAALLAEPSYPRTIVASLNDAWTGKSSDFSYPIGRVLFPYIEDAPLRDDRNVLPPLSEPAIVHLKTRAEVIGVANLPMQFEIHSSWPVELKINGVPHVPLQQTQNYFTEIVTYATLEPGIHEIELRFHYMPGETNGFAVGYSYWENHWRYRELLGVNTERLRFIPIDQPSQTAKR